MLVIISFATATSIQTTKTDTKKVSPLYQVRTNNAIEKNSEKIYSKFIRNRLFVLPNLIKINYQNSQNSEDVKICSYKSSACTRYGTCHITLCGQITCCWYCNQDLLRIGKIPTNGCTYPWNTCYPNC